MSLPETYRSGVHMARVLTSYIDCPHRIQREIATSFHETPTIETIRRLRAEHLTPRRHQVAAIKPYEGYYPEEASDAAEIANKVFLKSLLRERAA